MISRLDISVVNVIINKKGITDTEYPILENALTYNIQRIENNSKGEWNYLIITDKRRLAPMRKTARFKNFSKTILIKRTCLHLFFPSAYLIQSL